MKHVQGITLLLFLAIMGLSGCDQARDIATEAAEKAKKDVVSEIGKAINGGEQDNKEDTGSNKDSETEKDEEK